MSRCISKLCSHSSSFANEGLEQKVEKEKKKQQRLNWSSACLYFAEAK